MKDDLPYFSHDNNARRHPKMRALIAEYGFEGYGRFWALNERIAESPGAYIDISRKVNRLDLANELGLNGGGLDEFLSFLADPEINLINIDDNLITTDRNTELFLKIKATREYERNKKLRKKKEKKIPKEKTNSQREKAVFPMEKRRFPRYSLRKKGQKRRE